MTSTKVATLPAPAIRIRIAGSSLGAAIPLSPNCNSLSKDLSHLVKKLPDQPLCAHVNLEKGERSKLAMLARELL